MFPDVPLSDEPVVIDQRDCGFVPRVVGARVGQLVQIRNSDPLLHNVHSLSSGANSFNVGQPVEGMVFEVRLDEEEGMLRIKCDVHRWMTEYVGVVSHPYFAVSDRGGTFTIDQVPARYTDHRGGHEVYGTPHTDSRCRGRRRHGGRLHLSGSYDMMLRWSRVTCVARAAGLAVVFCVHGACEHRGRHPRRTKPSTRQRVGS